MQIPKYIKEKDNTVVWVGTYTTNDHHHHHYHPHPHNPSSPPHHHRETRLEIVLQDYGFRIWNFEFELGIGDGIRIGDWNGDLDQNWYTDGKLSLSLRGI